MAVNPDALSALHVMADAPVIPVIVLTDIAHAVPLARALSSLRRAGLVTATKDGRYAVPTPEKLAGLCSN